MFFNDAHGVRWLNRNILCVFMQHISAGLKSFGEKVFPCIMSNDVWGDDIYIYPARSKSVPDVYSVHWWKTCGWLVVCHIVDNMKDWSSIFVKDIGIDVVIRTEVILKHKLELSWGMCILLKCRKWRVMAYIVRCECGRVDLRDFCEEKYETKFRRRYGQRGGEAYVVEQL